MPKNYISIVILENLERKSFRNHIRKILKLFLQHSLQYELTSMFRKKKNCQLPKKHHSL